MHQLLSNSDLILFPWDRAPAVTSMDQQVACQLADSGFWKPQPTLTTPCKISKSQIHNAGKLLPRYKYNDKQQTKFDMVDQCN